MNIFIQFFRREIFFKKKGEGRRTVWMRTDRNMQFFKFESLEHLTIEKP